MTKKGLEMPMGKGKGDVEKFVARVKRGRIMFEVTGLDEATAKFVNYVPSENSATAKSCSSKSGKACCSKGAKSCAKGQANAGSSDANSVVAPTK